MTLSPKTILIVDLVLGGLPLVLILLLRSQLARLLGGLTARLAAQERRLADLAERVDLDPLTGCWNRRAGERRMSECLRVAPCVVVFLDVQDFGATNTARGHAEGDRLLAGLAGLLRASFRRAHDTVYRFGGDEFVICCPAFPDRVDPLAPAEPRDPRDHLALVQTYAEACLAQVAEAAEVRFLYGLSTTRRAGAAGVFAAAEAEMREKKQRRNAGRAADERARARRAHAPEGEDLHEVMT